MRNNNHIFYCYIVSIIFFTSCEKFVDIPLPNSQLTGATVFKDVSTANAAAINFYNRLRTDVLVHGSGNGISNLLGNYTDELANYSSGTTGEKFYLNSLLPTDFAVSSLWQNCYSLIYSTNALIEGLNQSTSIAEEDKKKLEAEGLFVRAYIHFHLFNLFGPIPYVTSTDYRINTSVGRVDSAALYRLVIADLTTAQNNLPDAYSSTERIRPTKDIATAMLARVYLYAQNWEAAESQSTSIIDNSPMYSLVNNLDSVFLKWSTGTIWQLKPNDEGLNTNEALTFIFTSGPPLNMAVSKNLVDAFEANDERKQHWLGSVSKGAEVWYYPYKYKLNSNTATSREYSILLRLEEQFLIRAEARLHQGNMDGAKEDLNKIRQRAGLQNTTADNEDELMRAIMQERRIEFFSELGHRWFDLKRTGNANNVLSLVKPNWDAKDMLWPIPESELILNPHLLPQNAGY